MCTYYANCFPLETIFHGVPVIGLPFGKLCLMCFKKNANSIFKATNL